MSLSSGNSKAKKIRLAMACAAAILASIIPLILIVDGQKYFDSISDLPEYLVAAKLVLAGRGSQIYQSKEVSDARHVWFPHLRERSVAIFSPPAALPLLAPLGFVPLSLVKPFWLIALASAVLLSVVMLAPMFNLTYSQSLWIWAVLVLSGPFYDAIRIGQITPLMLLALTSGLLFSASNKVIPAALCFSTFVLKPQEILPLMIYFLGAKQYRLFFTTLIAVAALSLLALLMLGPNAYVNYFQLLSNQHLYMSEMQPELTPTIRGQLLRIPALSHDFVSVVYYLTFIAALAFSFVLGSRFSKSKKWLEAGTIAIIPLGLATAILCHYYDLLLLAPSVVALISSRALSQLSSKSINWLTLLAMAALAIFLIPLSIPIHYNYLLKGGIFNPNFLVLAAYSGFACALVWVNKSNFD